MSGKRRATVPLILALLALPAPALAAPAVTNTGDSGAGSLRQAIVDASDGDTIDIPAGTYTLTGGQLEIDKSLTLVGASARTTSLDAGGSSRVLNVDSGETLHVARVTVTGGHADQGGGIFNNGTLFVDSAQVTGNTAIGDAMFGGQGGGIFHNGTAMTVTNSNVSGNVADGSAGATFSGGQGGGIFANDPYTLSNVTVAGNEAKPAPGASFPDGQGGGIFANDVGTLTNVTIAGNVSSGAADNAAGGIFINDETTFTNSIMARNTVGGAENDCLVNDTVHDGGHNLEGASDCGLTGAGDLHNADPLLGALANNGGESDTRALGIGSPAIDTADAAACPATDQRGIARPQGAGCDIGAFELAKPAAAPPPAPQGPQAAGSCNDRLKPITHLRSKGVKRTRTKIRLRGTSRDRREACPSGLRLVQVSLARVSGRTGTNCRFLRSRTKYRLTRPQNCRRPVLFTAKGKRSWSFVFKLDLPPGKYRAQARATDKARHKETPRQRRNIVIFKVR
jgi:hypothetical protein